MTSQKPSNADAGQEAAWRVGPRTLPPPDGASDVLRDSISNTPTPDPAPNLKLDPQSEAEWLALIA